MPRLLAGMLVGLFLGIAGTLGVQRVRQQRESAEAKRTLDVFEIVPIVMERALPGVRVLDIALETSSTETAGHESDVLYDAHITYQLGGKIKRVTLPFGRSKNGPIFPDTTQIVIADDGAKLVQTLATSPGAGVQPNNEMQRTRPAQAKEPRR